MAAAEPLRPRLCRLVRGEHGYGFHLHGEKGRRGQFIRRVEPGSPAEAAALRAGDRLVEVNGVNVEGETHHQVVQRIKAVEGQTRLLVVDKETDEELRRRQLTCTEEMAQRGLPPTHDPWEPKPDWARASNLSSEAGQKDVGGPPRELRPRLCHLRKGPQGYGFNLHSDKSRPGQYIRSVDPGSPAAHSGLRAQDRLIEVPVVEALGCWGPHERCVSGPVSLHVCVWLVCPRVCLVRVPQVCVWACVPPCVCLARVPLGCVSGPCRSMCVSGLCALGCVSGLVCPRVCVWARVPPCVCLARVPLGCVSGLVCPDVCLARVPPCVCLACVPRVCLGSKVLAGERCWELELAFLFLPRLVTTLMNI
ncbi:Na(+)/H(+) exchange regulatory cofactor NHE-RF2 isoform X2 [Canis lupus dingo]|uniref:Na(+)/H(+) exchange regulatory cofactor NHE-RF2 isoform X2 n=1 Tax=Canis lupus dingo TaxID=286419 RepID=UPI0020C3A309|nr:Na(+)/H(+) exchange regulatory cofactor NHE-RF2 isoform X2 [Canis lupus dingo]